MAHGLRRPGGLLSGYSLVVLGCLVAALGASFTPLGEQIDNDAADWMFRLSPPPAGPASSVILAIDDEALGAGGGLRGLRSLLATGLGRLAGAQPKVVVVDVTLADRGDPGEDARLAEAMSRTPNLVLGCDLVEGGWQQPAAEFARWAKAVGHAHADPDSGDAVNRHIPLEKAAGRERRWAMALEAYRLYRGAAIEESPNDLAVGGLTIPAARRDARALRIRYRHPSSPVPRLRWQDFATGEGWRETVRDKVVFVGVTAQTAARDRLMTPYSGGLPMPGVEIHASAFETLAGGRFLRDAPLSAVLLVSLLIAAAAALIFHKLAGWVAYLAGAGLILAAHSTPHLLFTQDVLLSYSALVGTAWLSVVGAAGYQYFAVRRALRRSETEKARYQQAIHFVTHEMRTPLTAIQGSSELISRYNLNEDKRKQIAQMINAESKRLARMIQTFLDVERLSEGQMDLKREVFPVAALADACLDRARPVADRKNIGLHRTGIPEASLTGDRELMEYALYNLLTNAVKYSPEGTEVELGGKLQEDNLRLWVKDQGIGMDETEVRNIFRKFYRTRRAEASGEVGTGIGLSIVEQIVTHHGGRIEVASAPGKGSCFTLVLPAAAAVEKP